MTYVVQVERELPLDESAVAATVERVLTDRRGWRAGGHVLTRVDDPEDAEVHVVVATPETADRLCAPLNTQGRLSCRMGENVVLNAWRWVNGSPGYANAAARYRTYLVNHEVGHALGYPHVSCPAARAIAPVMLQQTKGLDGCRPNPWPAGVDLD